MEVGINTLFGLGVESGGLVYSDFDRK